MGKKPNNYIDNKRFYEAICQHHEKVELAKSEGKEEPRLSEYIGKCIYDIATHLTYHPWFINYSDSYKEEMVGKAIDNCLTYFNNFNHNKYKNPFSYFTQVSYFAFKFIIQRERKNQYIKYKYFENMMTGLDYNESEETKKSLTDNKMYDNISTFIEKFEADEETKREKRRKKLKSKKEIDDA